MASGPGRYSASSGTGVDCCSVAIIRTTCKLPTSCMYGNVKGQSSGTGAQACEWSLTRLDCAERLVLFPTPWPGEALVACADGTCDTGCFPVVCILQTLDQRGQLPAAS